MKKLNVHSFKKIVFFTGAGMSAESGVPTYRGEGGIWHKYNWEEYACQLAFDKDPDKVLRFHELRRETILDCQPHSGYYVLSQIEKQHPNVVVVTQNIDGLHQQAGTQYIIELHGSLWRLRCTTCNSIIYDRGEKYKNYRHSCGTWLRPDITWFSDYLDMKIIDKATKVISYCSLFLSIGTSGVVWPAAGFPQIARDSGAHCIEINPETTELSSLFHTTIRGKAGEILPCLFEK